MKRTIRTISFLIMAALGYGCADNGADLSIDEVSDSVTAAADPIPAGDYVHATDAQLGDLATLSLHEDGTFTRRFEVVDCQPIRGCVDETGTFALTHSTRTGVQFIGFYDEDGVLMDRFSYAYKIDGVTFRHDNEARAFTMTAAQ